MGMSRQRAPVRTRHRIPLISCRLLHDGGRPDRQGRGSKGSSFAHCASVRSNRPVTGRVFTRSPVFRFFLVDEPFTGDLTHVCSSTRRAALIQGGRAEQLTSTHALVVLFGEVGDAVVSPATSTRSLDARSPVTIRAQKRVSPSRQYELGRGRAPPPRNKEETETDPRPKGVCRLHNTKHKKRAQPQRRCTVQGTPCPPDLWRGSNPLDVESCAHLLPFLWEGALPRSSSRTRRGLTRFCAYMPEGLRASRDRVRTAGDTTARYAQGAFGQKGRRTARGLWLSEPVSCGAGRPCTVHVLWGPALCVVERTWFLSGFLPTQRGAVLSVATGRTLADAALDRESDGLG